MSDSNFDGVLDPDADWPDIPQASTQFVVLGGQGGPLNEQAKALAARTKKLKSDMYNFSGGGFGGQYKNLAVIVSGTGYAGTITADVIVVESSDYKTSVIRGLNVSFNGATVGAGGLDTGVIAENAWYYIHVVYNPTSKTYAGLLSLSATAPSLPAGYTQWARVGAAYSLASSFRSSSKNGRYVLWGVGSTMTPVVLVSNSYSTTLVSFSTLPAQPPVSKKLSTRLILPSGSSGWAELDLDPGRQMPVIYINQVEQAFCAVIPILVTNTLYYITSGDSAKIYISAYGYEDSI